MIRSLFRKFRGSSKTYFRVGNQWISVHPEYGSWVLSQASVWAKKKSQLAECIKSHQRQGFLHWIMSLLKIGQAFASLGEPFVRKVMMLFPDLGTTGSIDRTWGAKSLGCPWNVWRWVFPIKKLTFHFLVGLLFFPHFKGGNLPPSNLWKTWQA